MHNEKVILIAGPSPWPFVAIGAISTIVAFVGLIWIEHGFKFTGSMLISSALSQIVFGICVFKSTSVMLTTHRIIKSDGVFQRSLKENELLDILTISVTQSVAGRIFGFGSLTFSTASSEQIEIVNIHRPWSFRRKCVEAKQAVKGH